MKLTTTQRGTVTVVKLQGNLMGGPDAVSLNTKLQELVDGGRKWVVIDMGAVEFMNSSGLSLLLKGASTLRTAGGMLKLANASEKIRSLITISKLDPIFETHPSLQAAVESFQR